VANGPIGQDLPPDAEVLAFVLRIRSVVSPLGRRMVINVDDVNGNESWHFTALDRAFDKIRDAVALRERSGGASGKPH